MILEQTTKKPQVSFWEKSAYGLGGGGEVLMANIIFILVYPIYQAGLGIDARWIGWAIGVPRLWDAIVDLLVGHISDNAKTRWGRRKPFIFAGAILTGLLCIAMWSPPTGQHKVVILGYFAVISVLFFTTYGVFAIPFYALGYELSSDYDERTSIMSFKTFFSQFIGTVFGPLAFPMCFWFGSNKIEGVRIVGLIFGITIILFGILPAIWCKERVLHQDPIRLRDAFKATLKNKPFLIACGVSLFMVVGYLLVFPLMYYINMAYILSGNEQMTSKLTMYGSYAYGITGFLSVPFINYGSRLFGKKAILVFGLVLVIVAIASSWFCFTPQHPYLQLVLFLMLGPAMTCAWVIVPSLMADICDFDELTTGCRQEGMYGAVNAFIQKAGISLIMIVSGYVISWTGYNADLNTSSSITIFRLRFMMILLPVLFLATALILAYIYPLSKKKVCEIQQSLKIMRVKVQG
ncbi:MAG: MFS transporter [Planctomycetaceae bacterium]|nr:MFS transporter [Planctomycetaceae bacterium]